MNLNEIVDSVVPRRDGGNEESLLVVSTFLLLVANVTAVNCWLWVVEQEGVV